MGQRLTLLPQPYILNQNMRGLGLLDSPLPVTSKGLAYELIISYTNGNPRHAVHDFENEQRENKREKLFESLVKSYCNC